MGFLSKGSIVTIWNHPPEFTKAFLAEHHDYVLVDAFHRIKAQLLHPCICRSPCHCKDLQARVLLTLNIGLYNQIELKQKDQRLLLAFRHLLQIPDDQYIRRHLGIIHTPDFIQASFQKKAKHFRIVDRLVWTLLRMGVTHLNSYYNQPWASLNEAVAIIIGNTPVKSKRREQEQEQPYLCGEKGYADHFRTYKPLCHFIAAFRLVDPSGKYPGFTLTKPAQIKKFLDCSHQLRARLLELETRNTKDPYLFMPGSLIPLPNWVDGSDIDIPIEPLADMLQFLKKKYENSPVYPA